MAISRVTTWASGNILTASALNGEFDNILNNALSLISPLTGNLDFSGNLIQNLSAGSVSAPSVSFNNDSNTGIYRSAADTVDISSGAVRSASFLTVASGVDYVTFTPAAAANPAAVLISGDGSDTNISIGLVPKGAGVVQVPVGLVATPGIAFAGDLDTGLYHSAANTVDISAGTIRAARFNTGTGLGVNFLDVTPGATSAGPTIAAAGSDTDVSLNVIGQGLNGVLFNANSGTPAANNAYRASVIKGWIKFNGSGTIAIVGSYNVTSITDDGSTGLYTITWDRDFADTTYVCVGNAKRTDASTVNVDIVGFHTFAAGSVQLVVSDNASDAGVDSVVITVIAIGPQ